MGDHPEHLAALVGDSGRRAVVIANAMDDAPADIRQAGVERELDALGALGFDAAELDLRDYFDAEERLRGELAGVAWAGRRGGKVLCSVTRCAAVAATRCSAVCWPRTRWFTPGTAPGL